MASETRLPLDTALPPEGERRRDFLYVATGAFAAVGAGAVVWPMINQMSPSADVLALASVDVDLAQVQPGQAIKLSWRGKPVFARHLTGTEIESANKVDVASLRDPQSLADRTKTAALVLSCPTDPRAMCTQLRTARGPWPHLGRSRSLRPSSTRKHDACYMRSRDRQLRSRRSRLCSY